MAVQLQSVLQGIVVTGEYESAHVGTCVAATASISVRSFVLTVTKWSSALSVPVSVDAR